MGPILYRLFTGDTRGPWRKATFDDLNYYYFSHQYWDEWERCSLLQWGGETNACAMKIVQFMISSDLMNLLIGMCQYSSNKRLSLEEIQQSEWMVAP